MRNGLSLRLKEIIRLCGSGKTIADVGCDHALVCISLVEDGKYEQAFAMDLRTGPLEAAAANAAAAGLSERISLRLSDGLRALRPGEAETILISGMGGDLIIRILEEGKECADRAERLVLGPQSHVPEVRRYLHSRGFALEDEIFLKDDGKYYSVLSAVHGGKENYSDTEYAFGRIPLLRRDGCLAEWLEKRKKIINGILESLSDNCSEKAGIRRGELLEEQRLITAALRQIRSDGYGACDDR